MHAKESRPSVLVIAATDSSGGAGLIRDVRVLTDFSVDALCVTTAVTAQSDKRVLSVHHVPPDVIRAQLTAALETRRVGAVKIGMLGTRATVEAVAESLAAIVATTAADAETIAATPQTRTDTAPAGDPTTAANPENQSGASIPARLSRVLSQGLTSPATTPIVLDPVLVSSSGGILLDARGRTALREKLLPRATLVTPNVPEIAALLGEPVATDEVEWVNQARRLLEFGCQAVLLKGGHATGEEAVDLLVTRTQTPHPERRQPDPTKSANSVGNIIIERITSRRTPTTSRGTGCALASAIAASLASGHPLLEACKRAKRYVLETMLTPPPPPES